MEMNSFDNVPAGMKAVPRFVLYLLNEIGKKVPRHPEKTDQHGVPLPWDSNDPKIFLTFERACELLATGKFSGIGFALDGGDAKWIAVDLDDCIDENGVISDFANMIIEEMNSYTEISPSGRGIKIFARAMFTPAPKKPGLELLTKGYSTITGNHHPGTPTTVEDRDAEIVALHKREFPDDLKAKKEEKEPLAATFTELRNEQLFKELCHLRERGYTDTELRAAAVAMNAARCRPPLDSHEVDETIKSATRYIEGDDPRQKKKDKRKDEKRLDREIKRELDAEDRPPFVMPEIVSLMERLKKEIDETAWRIANLLPVDARALLAAQFKAGKTTLTMNLVRALADGGNFLDCRVDTVDGTVVVLDFEMSDRQLAEWYRAADIENSDSVFLIPLRGSASGFDIRIPEVRSQWAERLKTLDCEFLVVDCLRPIMDALGLNEHSEAGLLLTALDALMKEAGVSEGLVVHHMGHAGERARGDSRLRDWPDVEWRLVRDKNEDEEKPNADRYFSAYGRDVNFEEVKLGYEPTSRLLSVDGGSRKDEKKERALDIVLDMLAEPMSGAQIEKALKGSVARDLRSRRARTRRRDAATPPRWKGLRE